MVRLHPVCRAPQLTKLQICAKKVHLPRAVVEFKSRHPLSHQCPTSHVNPINQLKLRLRSLPWVQLMRSQFRRQRKRCQRTCEARQPQRQELTLSKRKRCLKRTPLPKLQLDQLQLRKSDQCITAEVKTKERKRVSKVLNELSNAAQLALCRSPLRRQKLVILKVLLAPGRQFLKVLQALGQRLPFIRELKPELRRKVESLRTRALHQTSLRKELH